MAPFAVACSVRPFVVIAKGKGGSSAKGGQGGGRSAPMTPNEAARIQSAEARSHGGKIEKGSEAARAQARETAPAGCLRDWL